jgi:hypothetical protein
VIPRTEIEMTIAKKRARKRLLMRFVGFSRAAEFQFKSRKIRGRMTLSESRADKIRS